MFLFGSLKNLFSNKALVLTLFILVSAVGAMAAKGNLDRTFGVWGKVVTSATGTEKAYDAAIQPDGKIVVVGGASAGGSLFNVLVQRYNEDGTLDRSFNNSGRSIVVVTNAQSSIAQAVALQADGKILIAGNALSNSGDSVFMVMRLLPNGAIDSSFGNGGWMLIGPSATGGGASAIAIQNVDGADKIVVGGYAGSANTKFCVTRLEMNGQLDAAFGIKTIAVGGALDYFQDLAIDSQNRIVAVGYSRLNLGSGSFRDDFAVVRLTPDGALDTSFSGDGKVITQMGNSLAQPRSVVIQNVGGAEKIVVGGLARIASSDDFALARYNSDGTLDTTFDTDGRVFTTIAGDEQILKLLLQPNGNKIVAVGFTYVGTNRNFALTRYNTNGALDTTFGACGRIVTDLGTNTDIAYGAARQPDGKIVAVGESDNAGSTSADFAVVRYTTGGQASATNADYDGDGREDFSVYRPSDNVWYAKCTCQGARSVKFGLAGDVPQFGDYDGDGRTDQAVWRAGTWYINRSSDAHMAVVQFGLPGDVPTVGDYDGDDKADVSVWRPSTGVWYVLRSSDVQYTVTRFGEAGDKPVPADYDADGITDLAVYRGDGDWWLKLSSDASGNFVFRSFGIATDTVLPADFDGDNRADLNVYRAAEGNWYQQFFNNSVRVLHFGNSTDTPAPADFDGDNKADAAVYRNGEWHVLSSSNNVYSVTKFGLTGDVPTVVR